MEPQSPREVLAAVRRMEDELDAARRLSRARERELEDLRATVAAEQAVERHQVVEDLERVVELIAASWRDTRGRMATLAAEIAALRELTGELADRRRKDAEDDVLRRMATDIAELRAAASDLAAVRAVVTELPPLAAMAADVAELRRLPADVAELRRTAADVAELRRIADEARAAVRSARIEVRLGEIAPAPARPPGVRNGHDDAGGRGPAR